MTITTLSQSRASAIAEFLHANGLGDADTSPLAGDASNRRYIRITNRSDKLVLMDAPTERGEDVRPFVAVTSWLRSFGYSAPEIIAFDLDEGFLLLEDLGDDLFARVIGDPGISETDLYAHAVDLLADLSQHAPPQSVGSGEAKVPIVPYDRAVLHREALLLTDWWLPNAGDDTQHVDIGDAFIDVLDLSLTGVSSSTDVVVLRDYHAENLLWLPDRHGLSQVGLLDYQDALAGHPAYDLASLLEDARRDTSIELRSAMLDRYLARRSDIDREMFLAAYSALAAQRNIKIIGIFARLAVRDGKPKYLNLIPRVWQHLMRDLFHPSLSPLSDFVHRHVPPPTPETLARVAART